MQWAAVLAAHSSLPGRCAASGVVNRARLPQRVRETARQYKPLGSYHILLGSTLRSVPLGSLPEASGISARAAPASEPPLLGDARHAEAVTQLLALGQIWKALYASGR